MPTDIPSRPSTARQSTATVSTEISDATTSLLHLSLDIHAPPLPHKRELSEGSGPRVRRRSLEEIRVPPGYRGAASPEGAGERGSSHVGDQLGRSDGGEQREEGGGERVDDMLHPFEVSLHLLRRCNSEQELDVGEDDEDEDEFPEQQEPWRRRPASIASSITSHRSSRFGVRLEDHSDRETNAFATDVRIRGFYPVGEKAGGFVVFDCEIKTREGTMIRTLKRYSAFVKLRKDLLETFPRLKPLIPPLPPKSSLAKFRPSFLERRRQQLSFWLATVLLQPELGGSGIVRSFVLA